MLRPYLGAGISGAVILLTSALSICPTELAAQSRDLGAQRIVIDDNAGHRLRIIAPTSGWPGLGTFDWVLPFPPAGLSAGFVEAGSGVDQYLQWNVAGAYWEAIATLGGALGSGTANTLTKWAPDGLTLVNSAITETGNLVTINDNTLLLSGTTGATPVSGAGTRLMWIPSLAAFRAGTSTGAEWDAANIGPNSVAMGYSTQATGTGSVAMGYDNTATSHSSTAFGFTTTASNVFATAFGHLTTASGNTATAMGTSSNATGTASLATGGSTTASGSYSTSMGINTTASGNRSFAIGDNATASGVSSIAMGLISVASADNAVVIGTNSTASGQYATAIGRFANASGFVATAIGPSTAAIGDASIALGNGTDAIGMRSTAMGNASVASGNTSTSMGSLTAASGDASTAMGSQSVASGSASTAMGNNTTASGDNSTAMGNVTTASGASSTAMGSNVSTNNFAGSFIYGDASITNSVSTAADQFMVRAAGGTIFFSDAATTLGVSLAANGNAWASISDSNRKANRLNINGEDVLNKLSNIWMGSWNYKSQDKSTRHYGPMAQEFFAAFGNDGVGVIGNDTTLATADVDGVTLIAVKALIERNDALASRVEALEAVIRQLAIERETTIHRTMMK